MTFEMVDHDNGEVEKVSKGLRVGDALFEAGGKTRANGDGKGVKLRIASLTNGKSDDFG